VTAVRASGPFDVKTTPQAAAEGQGHGRLALDKTYHGDLEATARGEMLAAQGGVQGSAGYVAIEQVVGSLAGREGSFFLMHRGLMERGAPSLSIVVVPDSGTGGLTGLTGRMDILIEAGKHSYAFDYELPAA
jgi:hypothetical protein